MKAAIQRIIERAEGYLMLDMAGEAWAALDELPFPARHLPRVLKLRLEALCHEKQWDCMRILAAGMLKAKPQWAFAWLALARATAQMGRMTQARLSLARAVELNSGLKMRAVEDPLLAEVW